MIAKVEFIDNPNEVILKIITRNDTSKNRIIKMLKEKPIKLTI